MPARRRRAPRRAELSQHFLRTGAVPGSIVRQARISSGDLVVEIGPGRGALTAPLARVSGELVAVELDPGLCDELSVRFDDAPHVSIVHADFLGFELPEDPYRIVGNIPFNRTAEIVRRLTQADSPPTDAHLVMQREAGHRFSGRPFAHESVASLRLKPFWHVEIVRQLRRVDFDPPPRVDSVLLWLARRRRPLLHPDEAKRYDGLVESSFARGGNTIGRSLSSRFSRRQLARLSRDLRFELHAPPSHLSFGQWLGLFRFSELVGGR